MAEVVPRDRIRWLKTVRHHQFHVSHDSGLRGENKKCRIVVATNDATDAGAGEKMFCAPILSLSKSSLATGDRGRFGLGEHSVCHCHTWNLRLLQRQSGGGEREDESQPSPCSSPLSLPLKLPLEPSQRRRVQAHRHMGPPLLVRLARRDPSVLVKPSQRLAL